jgi:SAM-dependent methyltransferase
VTDRDDRLLRRATFDAVADRYDRVRPRYPARIFEDIEELGELRPGDRFLEIGPGTGQATVEIASRGFEIVAVELGPALAAIARRNLAAFPTAEVLVADFERWELPAEPFDAVVSASAFHWIDPDRRFMKVADALSPGGVVAIIGVDHVAGGTEAFFVDAQDCYERWDPTTEPGLRPPAADSVDVDVDEVARSGRFGPVTVRRYEWEERYTADEYVELMLTYSPNLVLEAAARDGLMDCLRSLINERYGGWVIKRYLATLRIARRLA